jgi:hypothetical protein
VFSNWLNISIWKWPIKQFTSLVASFIDDICFHPCTNLFHWIFFSPEEKDMTWGKHKTSKISIRSWDTSLGDFIHEPMFGILLSFIFYTWFVIITFIFENYGLESISCLERFFHVGTSSQLIYYPWFELVRIWACYSTKWVSKIGEIQSMHTDFEILRCCKVEVNFVMGNKWNLFLALTP